MKEMRRPRKKKVGWTLIPPTVHTRHSFEDSIPPAIDPGAPPSFITSGGVLENVDASGEIEQQQDGATDLEAQTPPPPPPSSPAPHSITSPEVRPSDSLSHLEEMIRLRFIILCMVLTSISIVGFMFVYWDSPSGRV